MPVFDKSEGYNAKTKYDISLCPSREYLYEKEKDVYPYNRIINYGGLL